MSRIDHLLAELRDAAPDRRLDQLEPAVWARIERRRAEQAPAGSFRLQLAVAAGALVIGLAVGQSVIVRTAPAPSEAVLLSDSASLAPSILLEGGA